MRALISFSSLLSAAICRLTSPCRCGCRASPSGWLLAPGGQRGFYQFPGACSCGGLPGQADRRPPMPGWYRPPMPPAKSPHSLCRSSRWYPPGGSSNRLSRLGCAGRSRPRSYALRHFAPHAPFSFKGRTVSMIWTWGLSVPLSWMAKSAHIPLSTKLSFT